MKQFLLLTLFVIFAIHVGAQQRKTSGVLGVKAAKVLDVRTGRYSADQMIWIDGDRIKAVGKAADIERQMPSGATIIDLSNATILPGLVDCHVHLTSNPSQLDLGPAGLHISYPRRALIGVRNARTTLEAGFTTVRNVAADGYADVALRDAINEGDVIGPRMLVSGPALSITGGHWDENYLGPQFTFSKEGVADGVAAVMKRVRENVKYGADLIKVMATGGVVSEGDNPAFEQYSPAELKAIVETAHGLGRKVAAHAHASLGIKNAVLAGVDSIEHGSYATDEDIQLMKEHGTYLVPTVYLEDWVLENLQTLGWTPSSMEKARTVIPIAHKNLAHVFKSGVKVALGTDAGVYPHGLNGHEFGKMVEMGLTPLQAIQAGTVSAADLLGWADKIGALEADKWADMIAVDGDPLRDVTTLEHVKFVMKGGEVIKNEWAKLSAIKAADTACACHQTGTNEEIPAHRCCAPPVACTAYALLAQAKTETGSAPKIPTRSSAMTELKSRRLFTLTMKLPPTLELGDTPAGKRRVFTVSAGQFVGDRLRGEVLPQAGSDLLLVRQDGSSQQDVRLILRTDDGALILMTYRGVRHASEEVNARIARGEHVPASDYYLRTAPFFETSSPRYAWLNKIVSVAIGERQPEGVSYEVFEIL